MKRLLIILFLFFAGITVSAQVSIIIRDSTVINTDDQAGTLIDIAKSVPATVLFQYNHLESNQLSSNMLQVGTNINESTDNNLDGAIVEKSYFEHTGWAGLNHMWMMGYNKNWHGRYNKFITPVLGIVLEDTAGTLNTEGGLYFNVLKKGRTNMIVNNGQNGTKIYNNTGYIPAHAPNYSAFLKVDVLTQVSPTATSNDVEFKNNIVMSANPLADLYAIGDSAYQTFDPDFNIIWWPGASGNEPTIYLIDSTKRISFTEWQARGFDVNSVIMDPDFIDTINLVPRNRLDYGTNLGPNYQTGLAVSAAWVAGLDVATQEQDAVKQVGAHIYNDNVLLYDSDVYFVAPNGSNDSIGSETAPWLTWQYAWDEAVPGDSIVYRGGTWPSSESDRDGIIYDPDNSHGSDGTRAEPITHMNYPGETPIMDFRNVENTSTTNPFVYGFYMNNLQFVNLKGLHFQNLFQRATPTSPPVGEPTYDIIIGLEVDDNCGNLEFRNMVGHTFGGIIFRTNGTSGTDSITFVNSDAYNACDSLHQSPSSIGSYGTGFSFSGIADSTGTIIGDSLRAWMCSDQGVTNPFGGNTILNFCWSFDHNNPTGGNGSGFKSGANSSTITQSRLDQISKVYNRCIAAYGGILTSGDGYTTNETGPNYNGYTYHLNNSLAWGMGRTGIRLRPNTEEGGATGERTLINNVGYNNGDWDYLIEGTVNTLTTNAWNDPPNITVTDAAWIETDSATIMTALYAARDSTGVLPDLADSGVFQLSSESVLRDAGTGVDNDIGPFQYDAQDPAVIPTVIITSTIISARSILVNSDCNDDGGAIGGVTGRGIVWSLTPNPDLGDNVIASGSGTGVYSITIPNLDVNTVIYIRAYATNSAGTGFSNQETKTTLKFSLLNYRNGANRIKY